VASAAATITIIKMVMGEGSVLFNAIVAALLFKDN
jgi:hypothetical protein